MRVLWLTNNLLPDISEYLKIPIINKTGWLHSAANQIKGVVELYVAALYGGNDINMVTLNHINYIQIPKAAVSSGECWTIISEKVNPDVIHIHGTEYSTGLGLIEKSDPDKIVVSIQGLISQVAEHYNFGISNVDILRHTTVRDIIKSDTLWHQKKRFAKSGAFELRYLRAAKNFIGRTTWDKAHILANNPNAKYYFNNETLRESFYDRTWIVDKAERHTIFFSQATYPMKGLHILLKALPIILKNYPDAKIKVAGFDKTKACRNNITGRLRGTTYGHYLHSLIGSLGLYEQVEFLGNIAEIEMRDAYLSSHVYVNASALENSSNSIGEAQLLGVPVVASFVGGTDSIVINNDTGLLYASDDIVRLASCVMQIFEDDNLAKRLSENGRSSALSRHDRSVNRDRLLEIYNEISTAKKS